MEAWQSWTIFGLATAGAVYYYTTSSGQKRRGSGWKPFTPQQAQRRNSSRSRTESKEKRRRENQIRGSGQVIDGAPDESVASTQTSGTESLRHGKGRKQQSSKLAQSSTAQTRNEQDQDRLQSVDQGDDEGMNNLEFAKQLSDKMTGTSLKKSDDPQNKKSRRQIKRPEASVADRNGAESTTSGAPPGQENSTASSTTGADADDDLSSSNSLELSATNATTPSGGDVSDMLEPPRKGPSILRLTSPTNSQPQRQSTIKKPVQESESKKQRQARRKREEQKAIREEVEKERRIALESQRRTAREAEGRPAKNGLGTSQQTSKNAWSSSAKAGGNNDTVRVPAQNAPLLDTFDEDTPAQDGSSDSKKSASTNIGLNDLPSEEEQIKRLSELESDNAWSTVSKGGKKKKGIAAPSTANDSTSDLLNNSKDNGTSSGGTGANSGFARGAPGTSLNAQANGTASNSQIPTGGTGDLEKRKKTTRETIDHTIWNRSNIHEHPDYDPAYPYALTGHPDDSDWAVV